MDKSQTLFDKYKSQLVAFILSLYCLPYAFTTPISATFDGAWYRGINFCIENKLIFGHDFVFTYGPLGFLSTRVGLNINNAVFYLFDLLLLVGFFHLIRQLLADRKGWVWPVLLFFALVLLRTANYSQVLFLLFVLYIALNLHNNFRSYFEVVYCAFAGVLLFYIKLNYGIVAVLLLSVVAIFIALYSRKTFLVFTISAMVLFLAIFFCVHIDLYHYVKYGLQLIACYDGAMYIPLEADHYPFLLAVLLLVLYLGILLFYFIALLRSKDARRNRFVYLVVMLMAVYLLYKNGFTRADYWHWWEFFAVFPVLVIGTLLFTRLAAMRWSAIAAVVCLAIAYYSTIYQANEDKPLPITWESTLRLRSAFSLKGYFSPDVNEYDEGMQSSRIPDAKRNIIRQGTIDIFPFDDIQMVYFNNFNYKPRPVPHGYSVYSEMLDHLNAGYFYKTGRPDFLLFQNFSIDNRYAFWDESVTKATLHLNYVYKDFVEFSGDSIKSFSYLLLQAKSGNGVIPKFEKIGGVTASMNEVVPVHFADSEAVYMKATINYDGMGNIYRLLYKVPELNITLHFDDGTTHRYRAVCSILQGPVLINKVVITSPEAKNFMTGNLKYNRNITGFSLDPATSGFDPKVNITFLRFSNY